MNLCGIDEAGRGPLAGPLVVAGVVLKNDIEGLNDSKKLTEKKREILYEQIILNSSYHIVSTSNDTIDEIGLSKAIKNSIEQIIKNIDANEYLMDGNTSFGINILQHKIKADATVKEVSAASILAKVTRDRFMCSLSKQFDKYEFDKHKGYGTKKHIELIKKYGLSSLHRKSFKLKALEEQPSLFN